LERMVAVLDAEAVSGPLPGRSPIQPPAVEDATGPVR
jgi:hypothetical protein